MIRAVAAEVILFLLPFVLFALFLVLRRRNPLRWEAWSDQAVYLVGAGLVLAIASLLYAGVAGERRSGSFEPTHIENGRVVPGRFQ